MALQPLAGRLAWRLLQEGVLHADETPVQQLDPGGGKTKKAYLWAYRGNGLGLGPPVVVFDYQASREGRHAAVFLDGWHGHLMVDDYAGYKALFHGKTVVELGCMAHARRKFFDLAKASGSPVAARAQAPDGGGTAKAMDYTLKRRDALARYAGTGHLPIDNNAVENDIRPVAVGKKNWLFAGSERAGKRAAPIPTLLGTARLNGLDPAAWLKDTLEKLPAWPASRIDELLPLRRGQQAD